MHPWQSREIATRANGQTFLDHHSRDWHPSFVMTMLILSLRGCYKNPWQSKEIATYINGSNTPGSPRP